MSLSLEWPSLLPLLVLIVWIGVAPAGWLNVTSTASQTVVQQSSQR
jgi:hypothetical protein